jgi:hypothetical protein
MPKALERKLRVQGRKKGFSGKRLDKYVYGTLRKTGWVPSRQKKKAKRRTSKRSMWSGIK